jgi:uncharacterized protein (TIGR01777 family)
MSTKILITGGTGFIGHRLVSDWCSKGYEVTVYSRRPGWVDDVWNNKVKSCNELSKLTEKFDILVNLAGEGIADKRWNAKRKQEILNSRIALTESLADWAKNTQQKFKLVISGSAIGYYGDQKAKALNESASMGQGFAAQLCNDWENAAMLMSDYSDRLCIVRTGVVLGEQGGMLSKLWFPFKMGLGGRLGSGRQFLSWIHRDDYIKAINWLINHPSEGVYNLTSPESVTNSKFTKTLTSLLHRPALAPMPTFMVKLLFGEMSEILLFSQNVIPGRLIAEGFNFQFAHLDDALKDVINKQFSNNTNSTKNNLVSPEVTREN